MTDSERQQILKMIDDGKISADQGLVLMQALGDEPEDEVALAEPPAVEVLSSIAPEATGADAGEHKTDPEFDRKVNRFRKLWTIPLWLGVALTVAGAYWMYSALQASGLGFWFFFAGLPFWSGVLLTALAFSSRTSRWIYINVKQKPGETPQRIVLVFPLSLVSWIYQFGKHSVPQRERGAVDEVMQALFESTHSSEPFMVDVKEEDGEHVQVYIG
jgi:hypothetical protein